jgi:hypothetical protein
MGTKKMCCDEIGLCAQNMITILGPIVKLIGRVFVTTRKERESLLGSLVTFASRL